MGVFKHFCSNLGPTYMELVKLILQYISEILELGLKFDKEANRPDSIVE